MEKEVVMMECSKIKCGMIHSDISENKLEELANSIKEYGVLEPLLVQKKNDYYELITGDRMYRAAVLAGLSKIPVIVKDYSKDE